MTLFKVLAITLIFVSSSWSQDKNSQEYRDLVLISICSNARPEKVIWLDSIAKLGANPSVTNQEGMQGSHQLVYFRTYLSDGDSHTWKKENETAAIQMMQILFTHGADKQAKTLKSQKNLLHLVPNQKMHSMLRFLLKEGVDMHALDKRGYPPIVYYKDYEELKILLEAGVNVRQKYTLNNKEWEIIDSWPKKQFPKIHQLLLDHGAVPRDKRK